jgi:hypothetical protein
VCKPPATTRPLTRSLDPLAGESLAGFLLRLSCRLRIMPLQLARVTGCISGTSTQIGRRLLLDLDIPAFAQATSLTPGEATGLTLLPWAGRYPPIARSRGPGWPKTFDEWLFHDDLRYCPACLAGDGSPVQQLYGGPWKKVWHLPISFACLDHQRLLHDSCPRRHPPDPATWRLVTQTSGKISHPAQCRRPANLSDRGRHRPSCGARLDQPPADPPVSPGLLSAQKRLLDLLALQSPPEDPARAFTDLRIIVALLCASWPLGQNLVEPPAVAAVTRHIDQLSAGVRKSRDALPRGLIATAGLLSAAVTVLDNPGLQNALARHIQISLPIRPSRSPLAPVLARHQAACSAALREAVEPAVRRYRRLAGPHSSRAPARTGGYHPEHIAAFLEDGWFQRHLAPLRCKNMTKLLRRAAAATLVQWSAGGSLGGAATFLGINPSGGQYAFTSDFYRWLNEHNARSRFTAVLKDLATDLDAATRPVNYQHRREALRNWSLDQDDWNTITECLPPVPGPVQPTLDDRKRQEASAFIWARITQGEPLFAPRPIEAEQPEHIQQAWLQRRGTTWHHLLRPQPLAHYAALRDLLIEHADHLAVQIDNRPPGPLSQQTRPRDDN